MSDMNEDICAHVYESRGYDRGFTAGTKHAHDLLTEYIDSLKHKRAVTEAEGLHVVGNIHMTMGLQKQINALEHAKLLIRTGHWDGDSDTN